MTRPRHLLDAWPLLRGRFADPRRLALFTDFDGTLVRIQRHPGAVQLSRAMRRVLARTAQAGALVGILSGRRLDDVSKRVGVRRIWYAGAHGFFLRDPANRRFTLLNPTLYALLQRTQRRVSRGLRGIPGIVVEPKGAAVAVHHRGASRANAARARAALMRCHADACGLHLMNGKKVWELIPARGGDKWAALQFILRRERKRRTTAPRTVIYLGDDTTDERVFRKMRGISVVVGRRHRTAARFFLRSPAEVRQFFIRMSEGLQ